MIDNKINNEINDIDFTQVRYESMSAKVATIDLTDNFYQFSTVGRTNVTEANDVVQTPNIEESRNKAEELRFNRKISKHEKIKDFLNQQCPTKILIEGVLPEGFPNVVIWFLAISTTTQVYLQK